MARTIQIVLDDAVERTLSDLAAKRGISIEELVSQAVSTEVFLARQRTGGGKVLVQDPDGSLNLLLPSRASGAPS